MTWHEGKLSNYGTHGVLPAARSNHTAEYSSYDGRIYMFGGCYGKDNPEVIFLSDLYAFEPSWTGPRSLFEICIGKVAGIHYPLPGTQKGKRKTAKLKQESVEEMLTRVLPEQVREALVMYQQKHQLLLGVKTLK